MAGSGVAAAGPSLGRLLASSEVTWGAAGWTFFIAENAILSENRTCLIRDVLGGNEETYHAVYGTISTVAMASIGYSYFKITRSKSKTPLFQVVPMGNRLVAWSLVSVGLALASQTFPKLQIPVTLASENKPDARDPVGPLAVDNASSSSSNVGGGYRFQFQVRCPFDFSDKHSATAGAAGEIRGLERVSRHPGLWSFGLVSAGAAALQSNVALRVWWMGPAAVAWLGGMHNDSRFRRGIGGSLDPMIESRTSNIPFLAMITGKQGSGCFSSLASETKPLNALIAVGVATMWVLSRGRMPL